MSRAMLVTVLYRVEGEPEGTAPSSFPDVVGGEWYADAVAWAVDEGIIEGYDTGLFGVADNVTWEQAVTILWRYAGKPESGESTGFADNGEIADYAMSAAAWAEEAGIVADREGNLFTPKAELPRYQAAVMLARFMQAKEKPAENHILVVYYSATDNTQRVAQIIADTLDADIFELEPVEPYTSADLNWSNSQSRVSREHNDESLRDVELVNAVPENWASYGTVFVGYPKL